MSPDAGLSSGGVVGFDHVALPLQRTAAAVLAAALDRAGAAVIEGPVERMGGRGLAGSSVYVRDPVGNLIEFITYPDDAKEHAHVS